MTKSIVALAISLAFSGAACTSSPSAPSGLQPLPDYPVLFEPTTVAPSLAYHCIARDRLVQVLLSTQPALPGTFTLASQEVVRIASVEGVFHVSHVDGPVCQ